MGQAFITAAIWATLGLLLAIPLMKIFHLWLVEKVWDAATSLLTLFGILCLLGIIWRTCGLGCTYLFALLLILAVVVWPYFEQRQEQRALREMRDEDISRYRNTIRLDPNNAAAHALLADAYAERGRYEDAIAEYEQAVALEGYQADCEHYRYKLKRIRAAQQGMTHRPILVCEACGCESPADLRLCRKCGRPLRVGFFAWLVKPDNWKTILKQSALATALIILLGLVLSPLPIEVKGTVAISTIAVGAFLLLRRMGE